MKSSKNLLLFLAIFLFTIGNAMAIPTPPQGYELSDSMDFWKITDHTTNLTGTAFFELRVEVASYESAFGLYTVDDIHNPTDVLAWFEIFSPDEEPDQFYGTNKTITFWEDNGNWKITADENLSPDSWKSFDSNFGFYFDVDAGNNGSIDYTFYTANNLNTQDAGIEHILTAFNPSTKNTYIFLEDLLSANADWDWKDMVVLANDVQPAPVPEPASMMLFGTGLIGLAAFSRRKLNSKK